MRRFSLLLLFLAFPVLLWAQPRQLTMYRDDGVCDTLPIDALDSATFRGDTMILHLTTGKRWRVNISGIDSMTYPFEGGPGVLLNQPTGDSTYRVGDTLTVCWRINPRVVTQGIVIQLSTDNGFSWAYIVYSAQPYPGPLYSGITGTLHWVIPEKAIFYGVERSLVSDSCLVKVHEYDRESDPERYAVSPRTFSIAASP